MIWKTINSTYIKYITAFISSMLFIECLGKIEGFYNIDDFFQNHETGLWALPWYNFFEIMNSVCFYTSFILSPTVYGAIFRYDALGCKNGTLVLLEK